jgi:hypothetical protein
LPRLEGGVEHARAGQPQLAAPARAVVSFDSTRAVGRHGIAGSTAAAA